jgi:hypothetical protein
LESLFSLDLSRLELRNPVRQKCSASGEVPGSVTFTVLVTLAVGDAVGIAAAERRNFAFERHLRSQ